MPFLRDESSHARVAPILALSRLGPSASGAVPELIEVLDDGILEARLAAIDTLLTLGPAARPALEALRQLAAEAPLALREAANHAARAIVSCPTPR